MKRLGKMRPKSLYSHINNFENAVIFVITLMRSSLFGSGYDWPGPGQHNIIKKLRSLSSCSKIYTYQLFIWVRKTKEIQLGITIYCQLNWDSQQGSVRTTLILVRAFWNFKLNVLKYPRNCKLQYTLITNFWHTLM